MNLQRSDLILRALLATGVLVALAESASALVVGGLVNATSPEGQPLALKMTIDDVKTRFELTGPSFSWFAWGFDTTTMQGYSIIIEGLDDTLSVVEQNLAGRGDPGEPQVTQNLDFIDAFYDADADLTTVILERLNDTGDAEDPVFSPTMTFLDLIFAYDSAATVDAPNALLRNHGRNGRGFAGIAFEPVPEASTAVLFMLGAGLSAARWRHRPRFRRTGRSRLRYVP